MAVGSMPLGRRVPFAAAKADPVSSGPVAAGSVHVGRDGCGTRYVVRTGGLDADVLPSGPRRHAAAPVHTGLSYRHVRAHGVAAVSDKSQAAVSLRLLVRAS